MRVPQPPPPLLLLLLVMMNWRLSDYYATTAMQLIACRSGLINHSSALAQYTFSALTLLVGWPEGHPACKKT